MALHWEWKDKCGEITLVQSHPDREDREFTISLYPGNAYLIMLYEYEIEKGQEFCKVFGFFNDKQHMLNCLGLDKKDKDAYNIYQTPYQKFTKLRINKAKYRHTKELISAFVDAFDQITIEVVNEPEVETDA